MKRRTVTAGLGIGLFLGATGAMIVAREVRRRDTAAGRALAQRTEQAQETLRTTAARVRAAVPEPVGAAGARIGESVGAAAGRAGAAAREGMERAWEAAQQLRAGRVGEAAAASREEGSGARAPAGGRSGVAASLLDRIREAGDALRARFREAVSAGKEAARERERELEEQYERETRRGGS